MKDQRKGKAAQDHQKRREQGNYRSGDAFGTRRPRTASEQTLETGGRGAGGGRYDPYGQGPPAQGQPVLPGQTGYINQRRPVLRPSANVAPTQPAHEAASEFKKTGQSAPVPTHRPYAQKFLDRLWGVREQQRARLFPQPAQQRPPDRSGTRYGYGGQMTRPPAGGGSGGDNGAGPGGEGNRGGSGAGGFFHDRQIRREY